MGKVNYQPKPLFTERMQELLGKDYESYAEILKKYPVKSIRCNKLKMTPDHLKKRLENKGWKIKQPFENYPEIMIVESPLLPGELGKAIEHLLGYYYIQELASMLPIIALDPKENETILDLCAAPGSKTTQLASEMNNTGTIIANDASLGRIRILASNLERCGVANTIIVKRDGFILARRLKKFDFLFDKILIDAPCSGEGTIRSTPKTYQMWNIKNVFNLSKIQKGLLGTCFDLLKVGGEIVYSTCTHSPEENEEVIDYFLKEFKDRVEIQKIKLPIIPRPGITKWKDKEYLEDVKYSCRVYPQDNNTEGFFLAKFKKLK
jgi:tRNA (cytosine49-C5)-methyltransferase